MEQTYFPRRFLIIKILTCFSLVLLSASSCLNLESRILLFPGHIMNDCTKSWHFGGIAFHMFVQFFWILCALESVCRVSESQCIPRQTESEPLGEGPRHQDSVQCCRRFWLAAKGPLCYFYLSNDPLEHVFSTFYVWKHWGQDWST